jgi:hypothetical protein
MNFSIALLKTTKSELPSETKIHQSVRQTARKTLLVCGIVSSLMYIAMTIIVAMQYKIKAIALFLKP